MIRHKRLRGFVIWEGTSTLDGKPIVLIAIRSRPNKLNAKTGAMLQTYILRSDVSPVEATKTGEDASICGECPHRKTSAGSCYVRVEQGPLKVFKAYSRGVYPRLRPYDAQLQLAGERVRLGAYGDPVAVPIEVWANVLGYVYAVTGYTHQWKLAASEGFKRYCMASCDNVAEAEQAQLRGWRTFTVVTKEAHAMRHGLPVVPRSFLCPASEEAGKRLTCSECLACGGHSSKNMASVYIPVHGVVFKQVRFNNLITIGGDHA